MARVLGCGIAVAGLLSLMTGPAAAQPQTEEEAPKPFIYATYLICDTFEQWKADAIVAHVFAPAYDAVMADGAIGGWGWMAHHTGGQWRRLLYYTAPTIEALLAVGDKVDAKVEEREQGRAADELGGVCPAHEDYIWRVRAGSPVEGRGEAGFSVYFICDEAREDRADELFEQTLAPVYDKQLSGGGLTNWGWLEHWVGGKYRRVLTLTGKDHPSLMKARDAAIEELLAKQEAAMEEFTGICNSHADYLWDVETAKP